MFCELCFAKDKSLKVLDARHRQTLEKIGISLGGPSFMQKWICAACELEIKIKEENLWMQLESKQLNNLLSEIHQGFLNNNNATLPATHFAQPPPAPVVKIEHNDDDDDVFIGEETLLESGGFENIASNEQEFQPHCSYLMNYAAKSTSSCLQTAAAASSAVNAHIICKKVFTISDDCIIIDDDDDDDDAAEKHANAAAEPYSSIVKQEFSFSNYTFSDQPFRISAFGGNISDSTESDNEFEYETYATSTYSNSIADKTYLPVRESVARPRTIAPPPPIIKLENDCKQIQNIKILSSKRLTMDSAGEQISSTSISSLSPITTTTTNENDYVFSSMFPAVRPAAADNDGKEYQTASAKSPSSTVADHASDKDYEDFAETSSSSSDCTVHSNDLSYAEDDSLSDASNYSQQKNSAKLNRSAHNFKNAIRKVGKIFRCNLCIKSKKFLKIASIRAHVKFEHFDVKYHLCTECNKRYESDSLLRKHYMQKHGMQGPLKLKTIVIKKPTADGQTADSNVTESSKICFKNVIRKKGDLYFCALCTKPMLCKTPQGVRSHVKFYHYGFRYVCSYCQAHFKSYNYIKSHQKNVHGVLDGPIVFKKPDEVSSNNSLPVNHDDDDDKAETKEPLACLSAKQNSEKVSQPLMMTNNKFNLTNVYKKIGLYFHCKLCTGTSKYTALAGLRSHVLQRHYGYRYICAICKAHYSSVVNLTKHCKSAHSMHDKPAIIFKVPKTNAQTESVKLEKQIESQPVEPVYKNNKIDFKNTFIKVNNNLYKCTYCKNSLNYKTTHGVRVHIKLSHYGYRYMCKYCEEYFISSNKLIRHYADAHKKTDAPILFQRPKSKTQQKTVSDKPTIVNNRFDLKSSYKKVGYYYHCLLCPKPLKLTTQTGLRSHILSLHYGYRYMCSYCANNYTTGGMLKRHCRMVHNVHNCPMIFKIPKQEKKQQEQQQQQQLEQKHEKEEASVNNSTLAVNTKISGNITYDGKVKKVGNFYYCNMCSKSMKCTTPQGIRFHIKLDHYGYRYACGYCSFKSRAHQSLKQHYINAHKTKKCPTVFKISKPEEFYKPADSEAQQLLPSLQNNSKISQPNVASGYGKVGSCYYCKICTNSKKYLCVTGVRQHIMVLHYGYRFLCALCDIQYTARANIKRHYRNKHQIKNPKLIFKIPKTKPTESLPPALKTTVKTAECQLKTVQQTAANDGGDDEDNNNKPSSIQNKLNINELYKKFGLYYYCTLCSSKSAQYKAQTGVRSHILAQHYGYRFCCSLCDMNYTSYANVKLHYKNVHKTNANAPLIFKIPNTDNKNVEQFKQENDVQEEQEEEDEEEEEQPVSAEERRCDKWHFGGRVLNIGNYFYCKLCGDSSRKYKIANSVKVHIKSDHFGCRYKCCYCSQQYTNMTNLQRHFKAAHKKKLTSALKQHIINKAEKAASFKTKPTVVVPINKAAAAAAKVRKVCGRKPRANVKVASKKIGEFYYCGYCKKSEKYRSTTTLRRHTFVQHYGYRFVCSHCDKNYTTYENMRKHYRRAHKNMICRPVFKVAEDVPPHMLVVSNKRQRPKAKTKEIMPFKAENANETIIDGDDNDIAEHNLNNSNDSSFKSDIFNLENTYREFENFFYCKLCSLSAKYKAAQAVRNHILLQHYGYRYICSYCETKFTSYGNLMLHYDKAHDSADGPVLFKKVQDEQLEDFGVMPSTSSNSAATKQEKSPTPTATAQSTPLQPCFKNNKFNFENTFTKIANHYRCNLCIKSEKYKLPQSVRVHIKLDHYGFRYLCSFCDAQYTCLSSVKSHTLNKHNQTDCPIIFEVPKAFTQQSIASSPTDSRRSSSIADSIKTDKTTKKILKSTAKCADVSATVVDGIDLSNRFKKIANIYCCCLCSSKQKSLQNMRNHLLLQHFGYRYLCGLCNQKYTAYVNLKLHHKNTHNRQDDPPVIFKNPEAKKPWHRKGSKYDGQIKKLGNHYVCTLCSKPTKYTQPRCVQQHLKVAHYGHRYSCTECKSNFLQPLALRQHYLQQHNITSGLVICQKPTANNKPTTSAAKRPSSLKVSKKNKFNIDSNFIRVKNVFKCTLCTNSQNYRVLNSVRTHIKYQHYGYRYICGDCDTIWGSAFRLRLHNKNRHNYDGPLKFEIPNEQQKSRLRQIDFTGTFKKISDSAYTCQLCDCAFEFRKPNGVQNHIKVTHYGFRYKCFKCELEFQASQTLKNHHVHEHHVQNGPIIFEPSAAQQATHNIVYKVN